MMPESALWSLIVALIMLALGLALKVAQLTHRINDLSKKFESSDSEFQSFQKQKDAEITNIKKLHDTRIDELSETISQLTAQLNNTKKEISPQNDLDETKVKILLFLAKQSMRIASSAIAAWIKLTHQATLYHLEELKSFDMINKQQPSILSHANWALSQEGRRYLVEHNLL
jgi:predicted RNase H-like nuclease (RuvC/YqgF family)